MRLGAVDVLALPASLDNDIGANAATEKTKFFGIMAGVDKTPVLTFVAALVVYNSLVGLLGLGNVTSKIAWNKRYLCMG